MWETELLIMLRTELGDLDGADYSDSRLRQVLAYAAYSVKGRATFLNNYTINVETISISPDPVESKDFDFCILVVMKAMCIITTGEARVASNKSVRIKDGPSSLDTVDAAKNMQVMAKEYCGQYESLMTQYQLCGGQETLGEAVLTPYSPGSLLSIWNNYNPGRSIW